MLPPPPAPDQDRDDFAEIKFAGAEEGDIGIFTVNMFY